MRGNKSPPARLVVYLLLFIVAGGLLVGLSNVARPAAQPYAMAPPLTTSTTHIINFGAASYYGLPSSNTLVVSSNPAPQSTAVGPTTYTPAPAGGMIEFFSNVTLDVASPALAVDDASAIAASFGGYVAYSSLEGATAVAVIRVPVASYGAVLGKVEALGNVTGMTSTSNDVSVQYTDLNATLQALYTEQGSLLRLLNQTNSINSTLLVESQLAQVNEQINSVESQIMTTQRLIDYSTITAFFEQHQAAPLLLKVTAAPGSGTSPLSVTFTAVVSGGSQGYVVNYNFGDGYSASGVVVIHSFAHPGDYNVTATATDSSGETVTRWAEIHVTSPPLRFDASGFAASVATLFVGVLEGIVEVAVVAVPLFLVGLAVYLPLKSILHGLSRKGSGQAAAPR
ncbi:MAG: DUF4349 domain-containing protein [Nitrososphaerota archaeon]|nr:DUF4349 domain-containing protein [Nitrososphaerota archaeon]